MRALHHVGAAAPGPVTPIRDEAPELAGGGGFKADQETSNGRDRIAALIASATARAFDMGIEAKPLGGGAWLLRSALGSDIGATRDAKALFAAVAGFEAARNDVLALIARRAGRAA
ncbi:MAG: hypothetical protein QM750_11805 [Rubrivivax sp.]